MAIEMDFLQEIGDPLNLCKLLVEGLREING
jgi:hypothetical protein